MITWEIIPDVHPPGADPGATFWEVNGQAADPDSPHRDDYDPRHFPDLQACLHFLHDRMKMGDTLHISGPDKGRYLRINLVKVGQKFEYDVGSDTFDNPEELFKFLGETLRAGDTVAYLVD